MAISRTRWRWLGILAAVASLALGYGLARLQTGAVEPPQVRLGFGRDAISRQTGTDQRVAALQQRVKAAPKDVAAYLDLASAYLQQVRETGDPSLYTKTAALLDRAGKLDPRNPDLLALRGQLALARHDFAGALAAGQAALAMNAENPRYYGVVGDAAIELGRYDDAVNAYQEMVNRRPDFASFTRVAYARELYGDPEGAEEAMRYAIEAGSAVPENLAWAYVQLGNLQFNLGRADDAAQSYATALQTVPDYPAGLAGQARLAAASGDLARAADLYRRAFDRMPLPEYAIALGDVYARLGDQQQARDTYDLVQAIDRLFQANGVNTDLEIALFYADHDRDLPTAVARARAAYAARPSVHAADALAWSLYKAGQYQEAGKYADEALKLGTRDPLKLFHAGMIASALGQRDRARADLQQVVDLNPHFSLLYQDLAAATLASLGGTVPTASGGGN